MITSQALITMTTLINVVSTISGMEMPSTPSAYSIPNAGSQLAVSVNCIAAVVRSNPK